MADPIIQGIPIDVVTRIFLYVDGKSLLESMSVCRFFARIIDKIIFEALHDDMHQHLFQIENITIEILTKYLSHSNNEEKLANLILAAYVSNNYEIIDKIIYDRITKIINLVDHPNNESLSICAEYPCQEIFRAPWKIFGYNSIYNAMCIRYARVITTIKKITEFELNSYKIEFDDLWHINDYLDTWFRTIVRANRTDILDQLYPSKCNIWTYIHKIL